MAEQDRTTVEVTPAQKDAIAELTNEYEPLREGVQRLLDAYNEAHTDPVQETAQNVNTDEIIDAIKDDLSMAPAVGVDEEEIVQRVCKRLDDLESQLPRKVANEVQQR
jgi:molybdopterin converting factor small subunit